MAGKPRADARNVIHFRAWRQRSELTQREVAEALGVGINTVSYWDNGRSPQIEHLPGIARLFGCSIDLLFQPPPSRR